MNENATQLGEVTLTSAIEKFRAQKNLADRAIEQLDDDALRRPLDENTNSIAVIMKHMAGNMRSRWTEFLTTDGEKEWRRRDTEFVDAFEDRRALLDDWERGWSCLLDTMTGLRPSDLTREVTIRGEPHTVIRAIHRAIDHYGYHIGQIVQLARFLARDNWTVLSIPRGQSEEYNRRAWKK
jgi:uncharacterized damage-inducible protein DinB